MAIKNLQNSYTTPEQSKILLELGLPADSADFIYTRYGGIHIIPNGAVYSKYSWIVSDGYETYPCWSVGRLMELHDICIEDEGAQYGWAPAGDYNYIDYIISRFEDEIIYFFKLEK